MINKNYLIQNAQVGLSSDVQMERQSEHRAQPWRRSAWQIEYFDSDRACYITIFTGQEPELRARDYYDAIERVRCDRAINWLKVILTYCVPYLVCTYGAVSYQLKKTDVTLEEGHDQGDAHVTRAR